MNKLFGAVALVLLAGVTMPALAGEPLVIPDEGFVVSDDVGALPAPVREKREALIAAARSGDIEQLRPLFAAEPVPPTVSFGEPEDAITYLKSESADGAGVEILAILRGLLDAPYAAVAADDGIPYFVWPYLAAYEDISALKPRELVDAYRVMGHTKFEEMRGLGSWFYWRVYVGAAGDLQAFVAGD